MHRHALFRFVSGASPGVILVELALAFPLLLLILGGIVDGGRLGLQKAEQDRRTTAIAEWISHRPGDESWHAVANDLLPDCDVERDDTGKPGIVRVGSTCTFEPLATHGLWDGLTISSEGVAVTGDPAPEPSPEASPSEDPS